MAYNVPDVSTTDISFGPGVVYMDPHSGLTGDPTTQVGSITEDGVTFEFGRESKVITQGNPRVPLLVFDQANDVTVTFTSIEWDLTTLSYLLGTGVVATGSPGSTPNTFKWGGDPSLTVFGIKIQHKSAQLDAHSTFNATPYINIRIWKAVPQENLSVALAQDEHQFPASFRALSGGETEWDGTALDSGSNMIKISYKSTSAL